MARKKSVKQKDKSLAILVHVLGIFTGFIGPLIIFLLSNEDAFAKENSKKALNWQLSSLIYSIVSIILVLILIGILGIIVISILNIIFSIIAAVKANEGEVWNYPLAIPFFK